MGKKKMARTIYLEVTVKQYYSFEEGMINGWPTPRVIEDWFENYDISEYHATRDSHHYGNTDVVNSVKVVTSEKLEAEVIPYKAKIKAVTTRMEERRDKLYKGEV